MAQTAFSAWIQTLLSCSAVISRQVHRSQVHFSPINMLPRVIFKCWKYIKLKCHDSVFSIDFVSCPSRWWNQIGNHILHNKIPGKRVLIFHHYEVKTKLPDSPVSYAPHTGRAPQLSFCNGDTCENLPPLLPSEKIIFWEWMQGGLNSETKVSV